MPRSWHWGLAKQKYISFIRDTITKFLANTSFTISSQQIIDLKYTNENPIEGHAIQYLKERGIDKKIIIKYYFVLKNQILSAMNHVHITRNNTFKGLCHFLIVICYFLIIFFCIS